MTGPVSADSAQRDHCAKCEAFPQVIVNGELVGGLDIVREMMESGEWDEVVGGGDEEDEKE